MLLTRILRQKFKDIASLLKSEEFGQPIELKGWLKSKRKMKHSIFFHMTDGLSLKQMQVIVPRTADLETLGHHSCLSVKGILVKSPGSMQSVEIHANEVKVIQAGAPDDYDFNVKINYSNDDLRTQAYIRPRIPQFASMFRIRSQVNLNIRKYFENEGFCRIHTPIITRNDCEGGGAIYKVNMDGKREDYSRNIKSDVGAYSLPVYLTVSGQLHLESMVSKGLRKVYTFNPAFRGEESSRFHLNEFWMIESEEVLGDDDETNYDLLLDRVENFVKYVVKSSLENCHEDLSNVWKFLKKQNTEKILQQSIEKPFIRITHEEACEALKNDDQSVVEKNINKKGELKLSQIYGNIPIFISRWPSKFKPFYSLQDKSNPEETFAMDLLAPQTGELVGGGLREHDYSTLYNNMPSKERNELSYYLDIRKNGHYKTGGYGLGFERLLQFLTGFENIRDTTIFYRGNGMCPC